MSEDITIPSGKYDWIWATHDRTAPAHADTLVIMIHGFPGDSTSYGDVFASVSARAVTDGFHTLRFDMRGCGQSNKAARFFTMRTAHEDCLSVLKWAQLQGYKKLFLVTEGLGAIIAVTALTDAVRPLMRGLVFLWPVLDMKTSWLGGYLPEADAAQKSGRDHIAFDNADAGLAFMNEVRQYDLTPYLSRIAMPLLVQHGDADTKSPSAQLDALKARVPHQYLEIVLYPGGNHGLKDPAHRAELLRQTADFLTKNAV